MVLGPPQPMPVGNPQPGTAVTGTYKQSRKGKEMLCHMQTANVQMIYCSKARIFPNQLRC